MPSCTPRGDRRARALPVPSPARCGVCVWLKGPVAVKRIEKPNDQHQDIFSRRRGHTYEHLRLHELPSRWDHGLCVVKVHPIRDRRHHPYGDARPGHRQGCDRPHYPRAETQRRLPFQFQRVRGRMHNLRGRDSGPSFPPPVEAASGAAAEEVVVSVPGGKSEAGRGGESGGQHQRISSCKVGDVVQGIAFAYRAGIRPTTSATRRLPAIVALTTTAYTASIGGS